MKTGQRCNSIHNTHLSQSASATGFNKEKQKGGSVLSKDDEIRGRVIESLLCTNTVSKDAVEKDFGIDFDSYFEAELLRLLDFDRDGLVSDLNGRTLRVTPIGQIFVRRIAHVFDVFQTTAVASRAV